MKCTHCGYENTQPGTACASCGKEFPVPVSQTIGPNPMEPLLLPVLKDHLFLTICILESIAATVSLFNGGGIPVLQILFTVFMWIVFAKANTNALHVGALKGISGTVYAHFILGLIAGILCIVGGALCLPASFLLEDQSELLHELWDELGSAVSLIPHFEKLSQWLIFGVCVFIVITGAISVCLNLLGWKKIHKFAQSLYQSVEFGTVNVLFADKAITWLLAFGILNTCIGLFNLLQGSLLSVVAGGCSAAALIVGSVLLRKHFSKSKPIQ